MTLKNQTILLCVTGGIAAYKAAELASKLTQKGADVYVLMSPGAKRFVAPLTFQALTGNPVYDDALDEKKAEEIAHVDLADRADLALVAPATANMIARLSLGLAECMISTTLLATRAPIWVAPAMNVNMYEHPAVQNHIQTLKNRGVTVFEPGEGQLACGWVGKGRMPEPAALIRAVEEEFRLRQSRPLAGKNVLITAGPTKEALDPVRFFSNRSSGKMGYALAEQAVRLGGNVTLVSGTKALAPPPGCEVVYVTTAEEMYEAVRLRFADADIVIKAAAVSDYRPVKTHSQKMKKKTGKITVEMERTPDILAELGKQKTKQLLVGFAAETENVAENAREKLKKKNVDMIVANDVSEPQAGFDVDTNTVCLFRADGNVQKLPNMAKIDVAEKILKEAIDLLSVGETR